MRGVQEIVGDPPGVLADVEFEAFFFEAEPRLRRALVARLGGERGREATAEALAWGFEHWDQVRTMANGVGYLYRVGVSRTRERKPLLRMVRSEAAPPAEPEAIEPEVWAALWALSDNQRVAVVLVHGYGWTMRDVGELLGIAVPTVGTHLRRGLAALRARLGVEIDAGRGGGDDA